MDFETHNQKQSEHFPQKGQYLICGIAPGDSGTGRFFRVLLQHALKHKFGVISPMPGLELSPLEQDQISTIKNSTVTILHPQYLGLAVTEKLLRNNADVRMYVLDSGFFCMQSYNHVAGEVRECLQCLGNPKNKRSACKPFPIRYTENENLEFLQSLQKHAQHITFFCQTKGQEALVKQHFGTGTRTHVVGMSTGECVTEELVPGPQKTFDLVYHGVSIEAKGARYSLELAAYIPECSILFPFSAQEAAAVIGAGKPLPQNCHFQPMRWENGLKAHVSHCRMVLVPSLWSAPVEGALIKSVYFNGRVGVFDTDFGFHREIPEQFLCRLTADYDASAAAIRKMLATPAPRSEARTWAAAYDTGVNLDSIFKLDIASIDQHQSKGFDQ